MAEERGKKCETERVGDRKKEGRWEIRRLREKEGVGSEGERKGER